jgi:glutathione S-transferase
MKLYTTGFAPNPRRVEIYLREKGIEVERVRLDLTKGEHRTPEALERNPLGLLPVLELDDGRHLTESVAICEYLEEMHPEPPLIGADPWQRAQTREALRVAEIGMLLGAARAVQNTLPFFATRIEQTPEKAEEGRRQFGRYARRLDQLLGERTWLAGDLFTIADITAICAIDFGRAAGCEPKAELENLAAWLERIRARPSLQRKPKPKG